MIPSAELTNRQQQVLNFIASHIKRVGFPPTIPEIQKHFAFKSPNAVEGHLKALARKGQIRRHPNKSRGLEIKSSVRNGNVQPNTISVPLVGSISAGVPLLAQENIETTIAVDASLVRGKGELFALKVQGDSMIKAGIYHGDIVIVCQQSSAQNGEIIVALLGEEATVKRFLLKDGVISLKPENDALEPISVSRREDFRVLGKVVATLRRIDS
jgi:repressor LexA